MRVSVSWLQWTLLCLRNKLLLYALGRQACVTMSMRTQWHRACINSASGVCRSFSLWDARMVLVLLGRCLCGVKFNEKSLRNQWHWTGIHNTSRDCYSFNYWGGPCNAGCVRHVGNTEGQVRYSREHKLLSNLRYMPVAWSPGQRCMIVKDPMTPGNNTDDVSVHIIFAFVRCSYFV